MPQKTQYHEPDAIDCNTMVAALGEDFSVLPEVVTSYALDVVQVVVRCRGLGQPGGDAVQVQALVRRPLRAAKNLWAMQYAALLDCWHQLDRGVLAVKKVDIVRGWDGRPEQPAKHVH